MTNNPYNDNPWLSEHQLAALVAPRTREVFRVLRIAGPLSVGELQDLLNFPSKTLYYQVSKLLKAGLIEESGTSKGSHRDRIVYRARAGKLSMPDGFQGIRYERLAAKSVAATLRTVIKRFAETAEQSEDRPELVDSLLLSTTSARLSPADIEELKQRLKDLAAEFSSRSSSVEPTVSLALVMTPHECRIGNRSLGKKESPG